MPTPLPPPVEIELFHAVGRVVTRWGFIDALLAEICRVLYSDLGGHSSQKKPPTKLSSRLDYIGKCFRNKDQLRSLAEGLEMVCVTIKDIDEHRNFLVHGCLTEYHPERAVFVFTKLKPNPTQSGYDQWSMDLTLADLGHVAEASKQVVSALSEVGKHLARLVEINQGK